jgi:thiamine monophosphate synthase
VSITFTVKVVVYTCASGVAVSLAVHKQQQTNRHAATTMFIGISTHDGAAAAAAASLTH